MSRSNTEAQQAETAKVSPALRKEHAADIRVEITRAFEVASAIEKAIRVVDGESLQEFLARVVNNLLGTANSVSSDFVIHKKSDYRARWPRMNYFTHEVEYFWIRIWDANAPTPNFFSIESHEKHGELNPQVNRALECFQRLGFVIHDVICDAEGDRLLTIMRAVQGINPSVMANALDSALREAWGVTRKEDIVCHFRNLNEMRWEDDNLMWRGRKLDGKMELRDCLQQIISHAPKLAYLDLTEYRDEDRRKLRIGRSQTEFAVTVLDFWALTEEQKAGIEAVFADTAFTRDPPDSADAIVTRACWIGQSNPGKLESVISDALAALGTSIESGHVHASLIVPFI